MLGVAGVHQCVYVCVSCLLFLYCVYVRLCRLLSLSHYLSISLSLYLFLSLSHTLSLCVQVSHALTSLNLSHNSVSDSGALVLAESLRNNPPRQRFVAPSDCKEMEMEPGAAAAAADADAPYGLQELNLSTNYIRNDGVLKLAECLRDNGALRVLDLSFNGVNLAHGGRGGLAEFEYIHGEAINQLAETIRQDGCPLLELNLTSSGCQDAQAVKLAEAIQTPHCRLKVLNLDRNGWIKAAGRAALQDALQTNLSIESLGSDPYWVGLLPSEAKRKVSDLFVLCECLKCMSPCRLYL